MNQASLPARRQTSFAEAELPDSVSQLIRFRWMAGLGVLIITLALKPVFNLVAPTGHLLAVGVFILLYNLVFYLISRSLGKSDLSRELYQLLAISQMVLDWIATIFLVHYSGGIESPALYFFFFHLAIVSIFFPPRVAGAFVAFALVLIYSLAGLEYFSILPHYSVVGFLGTPLFQNRLYILSVFVFFGFTAVFITYLVTNISDHLYRRVIQVIKLSESLQQATSRLQVLNKSAHTITSTLELTQVLDLLVRNTAEVMNVRACSIRLLDKSEQRLDALAVCGLSQAYLDKGPVLLENSPLDRKVLEGEVINIPDIRQSSLLQYPEEAVQEGFRSMLSAPLLGKNKPLGILRAYSEVKDHFTEDDESFLSAIAAEGSIAIENAIAYQSIEALEAAKSTFVRTFTHELRSPVGVIHSLLKNLTDGYAGDLTALQRDLLERAVRRTDFVQELIDDLLDLSATKLQDKSAEGTEPLALGDVLQQVVKRFEVPAHEKGLTLQYKIEAKESEALVMATREGLDRIFNNLVSNAVKYTPSGGNIAVGIVVSGDEVSATVEDTGIGIPKDAIPLLFTEFYRAPNAKNFESKGTGLGLAIVKDVVTRFGGRVSVQSVQGAGACFTVNFPKVRKTLNGKALAP
jgi:two-component system phosphate regulon sensor histidine kinase PhoR